MSSLIWLYNDFIYYNHHKISKFPSFIYYNTWSLSNLNRRMAFHMHLNRVNCSELFIKLIFYEFSAVTCQSTCKISLMFHSLYPICTGAMCICWINCAEPHEKKDMLAPWNTNLWHIYPPRKPCKHKRKYATAFCCIYTK